MNALSRIVPYMNIEKWRTLLNIFFISQFNYCPLIQMCHSSAKNNKIKGVHETYLMIIYNDKLSTFKELPEKDALSLFIQEIYGFLL